MLGNQVEWGFVDKRKTGLAVGNENVSRVVGNTIFTANAGGTTNTLVGANAAPGTNDNNTIRRNEKFKLYNSSGVLKEETVFRVTGIAVAGSTTVTFTPAAAGATASGDVARKVGGENLDDLDSLERFLLANGYTQATLDTMTINDKQFAYRSIVDSAGI